MAQVLTNRKGDNDDQLRQQMKNYWQVYSPWKESMMMSQDAANLAEDDQNEILSYMPTYCGKNVLELGAGIGRFTSKMATVADHVTAVDFMQELIDENQRKNQHLGNVSFMCKDVTKLDFPTRSFDFVFSNWLFMYLSDAETSEVFKRVLNWLKPGGYFFLRESCYHQSNDVKRSQNPTLYRTPLEYFQMLHKTSFDDKAVYKIIRGKSILAYIHHQGNPNQLCFLSQRLDSEDSDQMTQKLITLYKLNQIKTIERFYGFNWISPGGEVSARDFCSRLGLRPGQRVMDIGCGTGGSAVFMARHYDVQVHGVDITPNMFLLALERQGKLESELKNKLQFEMNNIVEADYVDDSYDVIYSRDSILHIQDKQRLFKKVYRWLRPGGTLFITDFCCGDVSASQQLLSWFRDVKCATLVTLESYKTQLQAAGFQEVNTEEMQEDFVKFHESSLKAFIATREAFVADLSQNDFDEICQYCSKKIQWAREGQLTWGAFTARKPEDPTL